MNTKEQIKARQESFKTLSGAPCLRGRLAKRQDGQVRKMKERAIRYGKYAYVGSRGTMNGRTIW